MEQLAELTKMLTLSIQEQAKTTQHIYNNDKNNNKNNRDKRS